MKKKIFNNEVHTFSNKHINNLIKLRNWVKENKSVIKNHFDMMHYVVHPDLSTFEKINVTQEQILAGTTKEGCNTSCCLLGWAAASGIFNEEKQSLTSLSWQDFAQELFGKQIKENNFYFHYLFGSQWSNDINEAINRMNYFIETKGDFNSYEYDYDKN